jgi:hypothetical protein
MREVKTADDLRDKTLSSLGMRSQKIVPLDRATVNDRTRENLDLLEEARRWWESMRDLRRRRNRNFKYYRGRQWSDEILDPVTGRWTTEEQIIMDQGKVPLKQNRIRNLVANVIGQYRVNPTKAVVLARGREDASLSEMLSNTLQCALDNNEAKELDPRAFEEFCLSGVGIQKVGYTYWKERNLEDLLIENVDVNRIFMNSDISDIRMRDLRFIGEIIDTTIDDIVSTFAQSTGEEKVIREMYAMLTTKDYFKDYGFDERRSESLDFYIPRDLDKARIYEIWKLHGEWRVYAHDPLDGTYDIVPFTLKQIAAQNDERLRMGLESGMPKEEVPLIEAEEVYEQFWYVKFLTPSGYCLWEGETPYEHDEHPYSIVLYPLVNGEVWGFVEDMIDQQRYINRMIILLDFIIGASAKGVLIVPIDIVPDDVTPEEFAEEYRKFNGVMFYTPKPHQQIPRQISANSTQVGILEMLNLQMSLLEKNSGINEAIQGQRAPSGTPAALYAQEAQNSTINIVDQIQSFQSMVLRRNRKALKVIVQFYQDVRHLAISGRAITPNEKLYDPDLVRNLDWEMTIAQGTDTPIYRQVVDDMLFELLKGNLIDLEMFLEHTSFPFADKLLESLRTRMQAADEQEAGTPSQMAPPELAHGAAQASPKAMELVRQAMGM